jgi:DNA adenine methylase
MNEQVSAWLTAVDGLPEAHQRLRKVEIRSMDATKFIARYDHKNALFYCDPPYLHSTRAAKNAYEFEMDESDHISLIKCLKQIKASSSKTKELKTECLWMNYEVIQ